MPRFRTDPSEPIYLALDALLSKLSTSMPATVQSYDPATQMGVFVPVVRRPIRSLADEDVDVYTKLPNVGCAVVWPRSGAGYFHAPLSAGDGVLLVFSQADFQAYRKTGKVGDPRDNRIFSMAHSWAVPGCFSRGQAIDALSGDPQIGRVGGAHIRFGESAAGVNVDPASPAAVQVAVADAVFRFVQQLQIAVVAGTNTDPTMFSGTNVAAAITAALGAMAAAPIPGPGLFGTPKLKV